MSIRSTGVVAAFILLPLALLWYVADARMERPARVDDPQSGDRRADARDAAGLTPLARAAAGAGRREVEAHLDGGADVNAAQPAGFTALLWAARMNEDPEVVRVLLLRGADAAARNEPGQMALHLAAAAGRAESARLLLAAGADANARCAAGRTPLIEAAQNGSAELVRRLLDAGADLEAADEDGHTPLMSAVLSDNADTADALVSAGARRDRVDADGRTAMQLARKMRAHRVLKVIGEE